MAVSKVKTKEKEQRTGQYIMSVIDVGFGFTKIFSNVKKGGTIIPSAVSTTRMVSPGNMSASDSINTNELVVEIDGVKSYVGNRALLDMTPVDKRTHMLDRANDEISRVLFRTAIALSLPDEEGDYDDIHVVTGLPNNSMGTEIQKDLEEFLLEPFTIKFHLNKTTSIEKRISVSKVTIYNQPLGTYTTHQFRYGDVANGENVVIEREDGKENVGVIDIGQLTTDFAIIVRDKLSENGRTIGSTIGVSEVYAEAAELIENTFMTLKRNSFIEITEADLDRAILQKKFRDAQIDHEVEDEVKEAVSYVAPRIIQFIFKKWGGQLERLEEVLITGGGAELFKEALEKEFAMRTSQKFTVVDSSQFANILGFYMRAVKDFAIEHGNERAYELFVEGVVDVE